MEVGDDVWVNFAEGWYRGRIERCRRGRNGQFVVWFYKDNAEEEYTFSEAVKDIWPVVHGSLELEEYCARDGETLTAIADARGVDAAMLVELNSKRYHNIRAELALEKRSSLLVPVDSAQHRSSKRLSPDGHCEFWTPHPHAMAIHLQRKQSINYT